MGKSKKASKGQWPSRVKRMRWDSKVYVGNLGKRATKAELKEAFAKYGPVKAIFVLKPSDGKRGCAFIEFERAKDAEVSVTKMDGKKLCGHRLRVEMSCDGNPQGARNFKCMCYLCKRHREEQSKSAVDQAESRWGLFLRVALKGRLGGF